MGTGNLEFDDAQAVTVPSGVTIEEVMVESGDHVVKGDVLAAIDKNSVTEAVAQLQDEINDLDTQILEYQEEDDEETLYSSVNGRVKIIYAEENEEITDVICEYGALMVFSMDGKMSVSLSAKAKAEEGDTVDVTLSSGTVVEGTVEEVKGNQCTVTVTDNGTLYGDEVTVTKSDGKELGTGQLDIHEPLSITAVSGIITDIYVSENQAITDETALITVQKQDGGSEYVQLLNKRKEKAEALSKLAGLIKNNKVTAQYSGIIQDVNVAASYETGSSSNMSSGNSSSNNSAASPMAFVDEPEEITSETPSPTEAPVQTVLYLTVAGSGQSSSSVLVVPTPVTGETPASEASAADGTYTGAITWNPAAQIFEGGTDYQALVILSAAEGYIFQSDSIAAVQNGALSGVHVSEDGKTMELQIAFPSTQQPQEAEVVEEDPSEEQREPSDNEEVNENAGDRNNNQSSIENNNMENTNGGNGSADLSAESGSQITPTAALENGSSGNGNAAGQNSSGGTLNIQGSTGSSSGANAGTEQDGTEEKTSGTSENNTSSSSYSTEVTAFTMSADENMILSVNVDELDINSVELGQEAAVTFDAIDGESFSGTVTSIDDTATVNGGVAKYSVRITIPKDDRMRQGMNASATITVEKRENVVTIPMNALQGQGDRVFVYTSQDEEGNLTGEQEIVTGLSGGSTVEVTEGLSAGDTVYYQKTGNSSGGSSSGGFGGMNFGNMGNMGNMERGNKGSGSGAPSGNTGNQMPPGM